MKQSQKPNVVPKTHTFAPEHLNAIFQMAFRAGHGNRSQVVQEAVEEKAKRELGDNWETVTIPPLAESSAA